MLRMIYGPVTVNGKWRTRCNKGLYSLGNELDSVKVVEIGRMRWLGQLFRMQRLDICRKLTVLKPEGTRRVGKPKMR
jgi:hypothetical protein